MNYICLPLFLCCLFFSASVSAKTEKELIQEYFRKLEDSGYDKRIAPEGSNGVKKKETFYTFNILTRNQCYVTLRERKNGMCLKLKDGVLYSPLDVTATMYILDISKVDADGMYFDAQLYFRQSWVDPRLMYSDKISRIIVKEVDKIWTPDLFFVNEKEGSLHKIIHPNIFCRIDSDGTVLFSVRVTEKFTCSMNFRKYPLDYQTCLIRLESYGFDRKHIELKWKSGNKPVDAEKNITETDFDLIDIVPSSRHIGLTFGNYSVLEVSLKLKRKAGYFTSNLYVPFIVLVSLSWLSLWMAAKERYLRLALLLVILYLMVTISTELNHKIPETSYAKASDVWIGFCEALVFAAFLEFIAVCILFRRESSESSSSGACEIELSLDPEAKDQNMSTESLKSPLNKVMKMLDARRGGYGRRTMSFTVDRISRIIFPVIFVLFNIVYWSVYTS